MNNPHRVKGARSPFSERNFRFQWLADLTTSLGFEMETLILGWFVLTSTQSVVWVAGFGALVFSGTLLAPLLGTMGDRIGHRNLLVWMRVTFLLAALCIATLALLDLFTPVMALVAAGLVGLIRPSDVGARSTLTADILPMDMLSGALGISRINTEGARILGAVAGAGSMAALGVGPAYVIVVLLYLNCTMLTLAVRQSPREVREKTAPSLWRDLLEGFSMARSSPTLLAALWLAWLANFAAYPISNGLLPHVAREVYGMDQSGLALLLSAFAFGGLSGAVIIGVCGVGRRPDRLMMFSAACWFVAIGAFAQSTDAVVGTPLMFAAGLAQAFCMLPMAVLLLRSTEPRFRGRVMGLRMLSIYGLPLGLLVAGAVIERFGFALVASCYALLGLLAMLLINWRWRAALWKDERVGGG
ncbi:MFS transporter [Rhodovarius crocodyli]|uniref:MFS transporter n=1 Tax=Rhodovarius crocodyli TaxID=1979269 RepID=A0A437MCC8_9PROT|nr:MFS transporter [Rhodovarius crocodyli]RVT95299.1 MFS transporter [Rhodovarius crocodyli]